MEARRTVAWALAIFAMCVIVIELTEGVWELVSLLGVGIGARVILIRFASRA